jgi:hypothetical protein
LFIPARFLSIPAPHETHLHTFCLFRRAARSTSHFEGTISDLFVQRRPQKAGEKALCAVQRKRPSPVEGTASVSNPLERLG